MKPIEEYRSLFPVCEKFTFLNNAAVSPLSTQAALAVRTLLDELSCEGISRYPRWMKQIAETRRLFAELVCADPGEIAFVPNTSEGLSIVANGLAWKSGDGVLVPLPDFPSNVYPWMNLGSLGVKVHFYRRREGRFTPEDIEKALSPGTRLLTVSSVDFLTGYYCDLEALGDLCRRKGILFCVDAIQSLGVIPMDVKKFGIHFLASGGHKWLLSTMGQGCLYVSKEANEAIRPTHVGWKSVVDEEDFYRIGLDLKQNALRFESGTMNLPGIVALGAALKLILEVGVERIRKRIFELNDLFYQGLEERSFKVATSMAEAERSGILSFLPSSNPDLLNRFLARKNVMVSLRGESIRLSPHFYNSTEDVEAFFEALDACRE